MLITQEEIETFPEDPKERFVCIEQLCRRRHEESISESDHSDFIRDSRLRYMTTVLSAAKWLNISPICNLDLPSRSRFDYEEYAEFISQIEYYSVQFMLAGAERNSKASIELEGSTRDRLLTLTSHLKEHIKKLDLPKRRYDALLSRINDFEKELSRPRLTFVGFAVLTLAVAGAISDVGGATDVVRKLMSQLQETVGIAKEQQDRKAAANLASRPSILRLVPPTESSRSPLSRETKYDLDDDIPF